LERVAETVLIPSRCDKRAGEDEKEDA
jgi:hypothetical protein